MYKIKITLLVIITTIAFRTKAQKVYKEGIVTYTFNGPHRNDDTQLFFKGDSSLMINPGGPVKIKIISAPAQGYCAVLVNVPLLSVKKVAILGPNELNEINKDMPEFIFSKTKETRQINGFNCNKVFATDKKRNKSYEIWITHDVSVPPNALNQMYAGLGGFPIQCISMVMGKPFITTVKSITEEKIPADSFSIPPDYELMNYQQVQAMSQAY